MSGRKNKHREYIDFTIIRPCLQIGSNVELKDLPTTGEEYLLKVMKEREKYATITTCDKDFSEFDKNRDCFIKEIPRAQVCDKLKPTIEWQNIQVANFSDIRMKISYLRQKKSECPHKIKYFQCIHSYQWKKMIEKSEPSLSCVLGLKNALVDKGLEHITRMLNGVPPGGKIDYNTGQWIYALLACVLQPLLTETTCILRDLARKCAEIRSRINPEDPDALEVVVPMNIFICIVGRYFRQYDLAD